jgi:hypothetical protein
MRAESVCYDFFVIGLFCEGVVVAKDFFATVKTQEIGFFAFWAERKQLFYYKRVGNLYITNT